MNPKNAPNYSQNTFPGVTIKLDGVRLDITGVSQDLDDEYTEELTTVQANSDNYIYGFVTNSISSPDVEVQALFQDVGFAFNHPCATQVNWSNTVSYVGRMVPSITYLSDHEGFEAGHQTLTIEGFGFDPGFYITTDAHHCPDPHPAPV